jgi:hypothetical protein
MGFRIISDNGLTKGRTGNHTVNPDLSGLHH